jgi:N-succinyldiaminopimelate aminotransferase
VNTPLSEKLIPFGTTIFSEMTRLAQAHGAINLAQGFPDFDGPPEIVEAAVAALRQGENQYARSQGHPRLVQAVADRYARHYGMHFDPMTEVGVYSGCTEGLMAAMQGLLNPGDEVVLFEPYYDSYPVCVAMAGARARFCTLRAPDFAFDPAAFEAAITPRTRLVVLNTPHNPTGKVFTADELRVFAEICVRHDLLVLADEVYEHLTYAPHVHVPVATAPGLAARTLTLSSAGKTFSLTGWKVGWGVGPAPLVAAAQAAHQFMTFSTATPLQAGLAAALNALDDDFFVRLTAEYTARRDFLVRALEGVGFRVRPPAGTYFILCELGDVWAGDDRSFAHHLVTEIGVAAIPPSVFYGASDDGRRLIRFAFCKRDATLTAAAERLSRLRPAGETSA